MDRWIGGQCHPSVCPSEEALHLRSRFDSTLEKGRENDDQGDFSFIQWLFPKAVGSESLVEALSVRSQTYIDTFALVHTQCDPI